jgi:hypothetical protein
MAAAAVKEVERARAQPLPPPSKGGGKKAKRPEPVTIVTGRKTYVDEFGEPIPDVEPNTLLPVWLAASALVTRNGMAPLTDDELTGLCASSAPVAQRYLGVFLAWLPELALAGCILGIMWPRVKKQALEKAQQENARATPPPAPAPKAPPAPVSAPTPANGVNPATPKPPVFVGLQEARLQ